MELQLHVLWNLRLASKKKKLEMCPLEHVWPAIQHSFKWGATTIKQQYKMGNQFKALNEKKIKFTSGDEY